MALNRLLYVRFYPSSHGKPQVAGDLARTWLRNLRADFYANDPPVCGRGAMRRRHHQPSVRPKIRCADTVRKRKRPSTFRPKKVAYGVSSSIASTKSAHATAPQKSTRGPGRATIARNMMPSAAPLE